MTTGAGTAERYPAPGQHRYVCPNGHGHIDNHPAWLWWCPRCPKGTPPVAGPDTRREDPRAHD